MSMHTSIRGFKDSKEHERHMRIREMCLKEKVSLPRETAAYFGDDSENISADAWGEDEIEKKLEIDIRSCVTEDNSYEMENRWEIDVKSIPPGVTRIRFTNSY